MTDITITQIVAAIADTIEDDAVGVEAVQSGDTLTESIQDTPLVQVYFQSEQTDIATGNNQTTFKGVVQQSEIVIHADVYARQRAHIGQEMAAVMTLAEAVRAVLAAQKVPPYFGLVGLKSFRWRAERVTFEYSDVKYAGIRFFITTRVF